MWAARAHNIHHMAGPLPITHTLQNQDGSICMCGAGGQKKTKQTGQEWHMPAWLANNTHVGSKGTQQAPHGWKQGRDHSRAAESGGIHMRVWGRRAKENKADRSRVAHASMASEQHTCGQQGHTTSTTWLEARPRSLTRCRIRMDPYACVVLGVRKQSRQVRVAHASIASQPASHIWATRAHNQHSWRAAWQSLTSCRIRRDPDACVG